MAESVSPQWPDRCCFYLSKRTEVILTGLVSILCDLVSIVTNAYVLIDPDLWRKGLIKISYIYSKKKKKIRHKSCKRPHRILAIFGRSVCCLFSWVVFGEKERLLSERAGLTHKQNRNGRVW